MEWTARANWIRTRTSEGAAGTFGTLPSLLSDTIVAGMDVAGPYIELQDTQSLCRILHALCRLNYNDRSLVDSMLEKAVEPGTEQLLSH